jgi:hypothetical protein
MHLQAAELLRRRRPQRHHRYPDPRHSNTDVMEAADPTLQEICY